MTDITEAFVVSLGLDPSQYNREIKKYRDDRKRLAEEDEKYNRQSEDAQKRSIAGIRSLRNETAGFLFLLAGANGVKDFAADILTGDAATGRLARNLGLATEQVSAWEGAIKRVGGSASDIDGALRSLSSAFQSLQLTGSTGKDADFQGLGVSAKDLQSPETALLRISEAAGRMNRPEFNARLSRIGFDQNTINLLAKGRGELERLLEEQRKLGVTTDRDAESAQRFQDAMAKLETVIKGKARPAVEGLATAISNIVDNQDAMSSFGAVTVGVLGSIAIAATAAYGPWIALAGAIALAYKVAERTPEQRREKWGETGQFLSLLAHGEFGKASDLFMKGFHEDVDPLLGRGGSQSTTAPASTSPPARRGRAVALAGNNPGGINDGAFARSQPGYAGANGRYAAFDTLEHGEAAQRALLASYVRRGYDTPAKIAARWAPAADRNNPTAYAASIARQLGIGVNDRISAGQIASFQRAQAFTENNAYGRLRPGLTAGRSTSVASSSTSQTTSVGQIVIYTAATDADGIAHDMRGALAKRGLVVQANTGLQP